MKQRSPSLFMMLPQTNTLWKDFFFPSWGYSCKLAHDKKKKNNAKKYLKYFNGPPAFFCRMFSVCGDPQILAFHDNAVSSRYVSIHGRWVPHNRRRTWRRPRTLCVLLTGYIAVVTLSPVWCHINKRHASTFCWNICGREISGIFPDNFCVLDQIFIRTTKPGKQCCCVWFFNKLGHAFVKGVRKRGLRRLFSIIKSSQNIWQITK